MYVKSFDTCGNIKAAKYFASLFLDVTDKEMPENIVQIITDNAGNFKAASLRPSMITFSGLRMWCTR